MKDCYTHGTTSPSGLQPGSSGALWLMPYVPIDTKKTRDRFSRGTVGGRKREGTVLGVRSSLHACMVAELDDCVTWLLSSIEKSINNHINIISKSI